MGRDKDFHNYFKCSDTVTPLHNYPKMFKKNLSDYLLRCLKLVDEWQGVLKLLV